MAVKRLDGAQYFADWLSRMPPFEHAVLGDMAECRRFLCIQPWPYVERQVGNIVPIPDAIFNIGHPGRKRVEVHRVSYPLNCRSDGLMDQPMSGMAVFSIATVR
jgi:hypothetical protein